MKPTTTRRQLLLIAASTALPLYAAAQTAPYPDRPIRVIVPYSAGVGADIVARALAQRMGEALAQPVTVENRDGAGGVIGTLAVLNAPRNGYTLLLQGNPFTIAPSITSSPQFDPLADFIPIAKLAIVPLAFLVNSSLPIHSMKDFVAYAKANPGKLTYASSGPGTGSQMEMELLKRAMGIDVQEIPYKSTSQAITDVLGGQVSVYTASLSSVVQHIKGGKVRAIALVSMTRSPLLPDLPTVPEGLGRPEYQSSPNWYGLYAPSGTPAPIVDVLRQQVQQIVKSTAYREQMEAAGAQPADPSEHELSRQMRGDVQRYTEMGRLMGLRK